MNIIYLIAFHYFYSFLSKVDRKLYLLDINYYKKVDKKVVFLPNLKTFTIF